MQLQDSYEISDFNVKGWPQIIVQGQLELIFRRFVRDAEGEILYAVYHTPAGTLVKVFND